MVDGTQRAYGDCTTDEGVSVILRRGPISRNECVFAAFCMGRRGRITEKAAVPDYQVLNTDGLLHQ